MIVIGGQFPKDPTAKACDVPDIWGQHNIILSKVESDSETYYWGKYIPSRNKYSVPSDIRNVIGGDEKGLSSQSKPDKGFNSPDVERLFGRPVAITERQPTRSAPAGPANTASATDDGPFSTPAKRATIIVPIVIGLLLLAGLAAFFILRRRKKTAYSAAPQDQPPVYKPRDSGAPESVLAPIPQYPPGSTSPAAGNWGNNNSVYAPPPHPHPSLDPNLQYATGSGGYSPRVFNDFGESPVTPGGGIPQGPVEMPQGHTPAPEVEGWSPPPLPRSPGSPGRLGSPANGQMSGQIQGHYPPPLPEGFEQGQRSPEMKELNPPGSGRGGV
jgi:LPXTG-motif cell wall-anchored protein